MHSRLSIDRTVAVVRVLLIIGAVLALAAAAWA
jgi:hypothetical protein